MSENLLNELRKHLDLNKDVRSPLNPNFFTDNGFTENQLDVREMEKLKIGDGFVNSWKKLIGDNEITVVYQVKSKKSLIIPKSDEIHVHLITKNLRTNEEQNEEYIWDERYSPLAKDEIL